MPVSENVQYLVVESIVNRSRAWSAFGRLKGKGNSIVIIEQNLDVIKTADYIVDLGPEGGDGGGRIIAKGTPEEVVKSKKSYTGKYLKNIL